MTGSYSTHAMRIVLLLAFLAATTAPALPTYRCTRTSSPITIDGKIDDAEWSAIEWSADFVRLRGEEKPALRTRAKLCFDEKFLYVAAEMSDPDIRATFRDRDAKLYTETAVEIFIDPDGDGKDYVELQINPHNATLDLRMSKPYTDGGKADFAFTLHDLRTAVAVRGTINDSTDRDECWTAELAIPIGEIAPKAASRWRINLARAWREPASDRSVYSTWSPIGQSNLHVPDRFGWLEFSK